MRWDSFVSIWCQLRSTQQNHGTRCTRGTTKEYDVSIVYGAMDGSDDLTKEVMCSECSYMYVCVGVV
jgi:hypothetical protein